MPRKQLSEENIANLPLPAAGKQVEYFDAGRQGQPGLVLRVNYGGRKTWRALHYQHRTAGPGSKKAGQRISVPTYFPIGLYPTISVEEARKRAKIFLKDPKKESVEDDTSFKAVAETFIKRYVEGKMKLRSQPDIERAFKKHLYPRWPDRKFVDINRNDINKLLDDIEDENGARMADLVLAYLRKCMNWYAVRDKDYTSPIIEGMNRSTADKRQRFLDEDEIRALWKVAASCGTFGALCKVALLTAQREAKIATMKWEDLDDDGLWTIATEKREKGNAGLLQLPASVLRIIKVQPRIVGNPYVFVGGSGGSYFKTFSHGKRDLDLLMLAELQKVGEARNDRTLLTMVAKVRTLLKALVSAKGEAQKKKLAAELKDIWWTFHDLRRTARSLMSRCKVPPHIAELVLGHKIRGVEGNYDVDTEYFAERADALKRLESRVERIVSPPKKR